MSTAVGIFIQIASTRGVSRSADVELCERAICHRDDDADDGRQGALGGVLPT